MAVVTGITMVDITVVMVMARMVMVVATLAMVMVVILVVTAMRHTVMHHRQPLQPLLHLQHSSDALTESSGCT